MKHTAIAPSLAAFVAAAFCSLAPLGAAGPKDDKIPVKPAPGVSDEEYRLGPGDKLRIEVYKDAQLSQSVQISGFPLRYDQVAQQAYAMLEKYC